MTAVGQLQAGASSNIDLDWNQIDWRKVKGNVRRLQARIVKAIEAGRWGKVKALQHLLTHSFSGKALAVRRVTENRGKRTAGIDGETWNTPKKKAQGINLCGSTAIGRNPCGGPTFLKATGRKDP